MPAFLSIINSRCKCCIYTSLAAIALGLLLVACLTNQPPPPVHITVDSGTTLQTLKGWEVTARLWEYDKKHDRYNGDWLAHADEIFSRIVNDYGINRVRLQALSGTENPVDYWSKFVSGEIGYKAFKNHFYEKINDNDSPEDTNLSGIQFSSLDYHIQNIVLPLKKKLEEKGERLFINFCYVDFNWTDLQGPLSHANEPQEYAEFILANFLYMQNHYGITPDSLEIILEPDNTAHWRGRQIGEAIVAVGNALEAHGFHPQIIAPSTAHLEQAPDYMREMLAVKGVAERLTTLSYHRYGAVNHVGSKRREVLQEIAEIAAAHGLETAMLEHVDGDIDELFEDLLIAQNSSWQQYAIATNYKDNGAYLLMADQHDDGSFSLRPAERTTLLGSVFQSARFGAKRLQTTSTDSEVEALAFTNTDQSTALHIYSRDAKPRRLRLTGVPAGRYRLQWTTMTGVLDQTNYLPEEIGIPQSGTIELSLPGKGLLSMVSADSD